MSSNVLFTPAADTTGWHINGDRLWASLMDLTQIGAAPKGGCHRLTPTDLDRQGRDKVIGWTWEAGVSITIDKIGSAFMRWGDRSPGLPSITSSNHIDTQSTSGKFDGNYGVLMALEVMRTLNDLQIDTDAPVEMMSQTNKERSCPIPAVIGPGVFAGVFPLEETWTVTDREDVSIGETLAQVGYIGEQTPGEYPIDAYFEVRIEQGPILKNEVKTTGIVQGILGIRWYSCVVTGQALHAGSTPMRLCQDALQVAAYTMQEVVTIARRSEEGRGTVGSMQVWPDNRSVVPGGATFSIDMCNLSDALVDEMGRQLRAFIAEVKQESGLQVALKQASHYPVAPLGTECQQVTTDATQRLGYPARSIVSGTRHDTVYMSYLTPTGMILISYKDGINRSETEYAPPEHVAAGTNVLLQVMLQYTWPVQTVVLPGGASSSRLSYCHPGKTVIPSRPGATDGGAINHGSYSLR